MTLPSLLKRIAGRSLDEFLGLGREERAAALRGTVGDLHYFFDGGVPVEERSAPPRTLELARSLYEALAPEAEARAAATLRERIVTDRLLREEADRDQNVYLGRLFTRRLTRAVPDLIFQPVSASEAARTLAWAREREVPVTLRGAASTAMGGSVPADGGLTLDLTRLDVVDVEAERGVCVVGAGARLRRVHQELAQRGLALPAYPSNLGGTLVGWFVTGGVGLNAFGRGRALDAVRTADVLLPSGEHVRFHDDGRLDVPAPGHRHLELRGDAARQWLAERQCGAFSLADLAGSEGAFGLVLHLAVKVEPRPEIGAFLIAFSGMSDALDAADFIARAAGDGELPAPANLKLLSASHLHHTRRVWRDEDGRRWRQMPGLLSAGAHMPWTRIVGPRELGGATSAEPHAAEAYLFVDFLDLGHARAFAAFAQRLPGGAAVLDEESVRFAAERFRPQQTKRLGPGLLAAEILLPVAELPAFLPQAESLARNAGRELDAEVYYLAGGEALVIAGYLTDQRRADFTLDLLLAPALLDLAARRHRGRPYVIGRWQAAWLVHKFGAEGAQRLRAMKRGLDPSDILNRGVLFGPRLRGAAGALAGRAMAPGVAATRRLYQTGALRPLVRGARALLRLLPGPLRGRGVPASPEDEHTDTVEGGSLHPRQAEPAPATVAPEPVARALHCVNCGECNSVCPVFHHSAVRLPQTLTHLVEALHGGAPVPASGSVLLDLCMRCGNCEEVCQAGIPHLSAYEALQRGSDRQRPRDVERHVGILTVLRSSPRYMRDFLQARPGGYLKRTPASLPGMARFLVLRAENDAGPAATCIHCGACVPVCPTNANRDFEGDDPRWITTVQERCIGCGTCVEVCPGNHANGGQTLRVMEAPTLDWLAAIKEFESKDKEYSYSGGAGGGTESPPPKSKTARASA